MPVGAVASLGDRVDAIAGPAAGPTYNLKSPQGLDHGRRIVHGRPVHDRSGRALRQGRATGRQVTVGISGTGGGFQRFCKGETDLSDASRPMKISEAKSCKDNNIGSWRAFTVANDALTVVVNQQNTWAKCLTVAELKKIWEPGSKVNNWKDVRAGFPDVPLKLFGPGTDSGTFDYFTEVINGKQKAQPLRLPGHRGRQRHSSRGSRASVAGWATSGSRTSTENQSKLNAVQIENPKTGNCVTPSKATVFNNTYKPLSRPLFIYAKGSSFKRKEVQAFLDYIFDNEVAIAKRADFISLTKPQLKRATGELHPRREGVKEDLTSPSDRLPV